jgi:ATP-binding cassette, subfamily B, bacterial
MRGLERSIDLGDEAKQPRLDTGPSMTADGDKAPGHPNVRLVRRLLGEVRPHRRRLLGLLFLELAAVPIMLLGPVPLKIAVDSVLGSHPLSQPVQAVLPPVIVDSKLGILLLAAVLQVLIVCLNQLQAATAYVLQVATGERLTLAFRARLFAHAQRLSLSFHDRRGTSDSIFRIQWDAEALKDIVQAAFPFVSSVVMVVAAVYVTVRIDWHLALVAVAVVPILLVLARRYQKRIRPRYTRLKELESGALGVVQEVLTTVRVVKAFGREDREHGRFMARAGAGARARVRIARAEGRFGLLVNLTTGLGTAAVLFIGVRNVQAGELTVGELLIVMNYLIQLYNPLENITKKVADLQSGLASAQRAFELIDEAPEVLDPPHARRLRRARGAIEFRNVWFAYDRGHPVLRHISFSVDPGTRLALVGETGAGKTTVTSLMTRFYDPDEGQILLDGVDIRELRVADLRQQFGIVLQEPVLFSTSVAENIAYADPRADAGALSAAAKAANAHDFITALPDGYETVVGERGMRLSGGERQRIALARAFLKDAPILILDEPTSSVDVNTEAAILDAMQRLMEGRTTFLIAHRPSALIVCDARIQLAHGRVVDATGIHDPLPARG